MKNISSLKHQGKMLISIFLYLIVYAINGQSVMNILETAPTVTSTESYLYQIYSQLPTSQQNYWVTFASFETAAEDGIIELNLPNLSTTFKMKVTQCEYTNLSEFTWSGMRILETESDQPASISLTKHLGLLSGEINLFGEFYQIFPINENYQILIKTNTLPTPYEGSINESGDPEPPIVDCSNANGACVINLMILYSLDVELKYINLTPIGFMLANQINNALKNSKISHRINLVAVLPIDDNFPEGNEEQERGLLKQLLADPISVTGMNKNFHKADLTMVLTSGKNYKTNNGFKTVGFAFTPSTNANEGAVINIDFALSRSYTFAHEFGHLLNARHNDDNGALPGRGHQISFRAKNYSTLLDKRDLSKRVLFYSNPNVNYYGQVPTGLADYYNACNMEQQGCNAALSGPSEDCKFRIKGTFSPIGSLPCNPPATQLTLEATLANEATSLCLQKTFFYKFEISHFGITYNSLCDWSTNKICIFSPYINFNNSVFIRLSIKESLNGPVIAIVFNKFDYPCPFGVPYLEHRAKLSASISNNIVLVSNTVPSTSFLKFFTDPIENNVIDYKICSIFGNAIISTRVNQTNGDIIIPIEGNYPPGVYLVYFEKYQKSFKFIIQ